jgi:hypothetical protein
MFLRILTIIYNELFKVNSKYPCIECECHSDNLYNTDLISQLRTNEIHQEFNGQFGYITGRQPLINIEVVTLEVGCSKLIGCQAESVLRKPPEKGGAYIMRLSTDWHKHGALKAGQTGQMGVFSRGFFSKKEEGKKRGGATY